jgi:hypothetical protein
MKSIDETPTEPVDYAALNAAWATLAAGVLVASTEDAPPVSELPVFGLAVFSLTKALAKEKVGVWIREPLVHEGADGRPPKGRRLRYAAGELLTCTRCLGTWTSLGLVGLRVLRPREGRIVTTVLASAALNDWLQAGFQATTAKANVEAKLADAPLEQWAAPRAATSAAG